MLWEYAVLSWASSITVSEGDGTQRAWWASVQLERIRGLAVLCGVLRACLRRLWATYLRSDNSAGDRLSLSGGTDKMEEAIHHGQPAGACLAGVRLPLLSQFDERLAGRRAV